MTDAKAGHSVEWPAGLTRIIRGSVHETRNALNGVVVNVEVVRSRIARAGATGVSATDVLSFAEQAASQAEAASELNEGVGALLSLIAAAVSRDGHLRCEPDDGSRAIRFEVDSDTAERLHPRLQSLGAAAGFTAERRGGSIILSIPRTRS